MNASSLKFKSHEQLEQMFVIRDRRSEQQQLILGERRLIGWLVGWSVALGTLLSMQEDGLVEDPTEFCECWLISLFPALDTFCQFSKPL